MRSLCKRLSRRGSATDRGQSRSSERTLLRRFGACLGECPQQAIELEEREAEAYDERKVMQRLLPKGEKVISAHLRHLATQGQQDYLQQAIDVLEENHLPIPVPANKSTPQNSFLFHATPTSATGGCPGSRNITFTPQSQNKPSVSRHRRKAKRIPSPHRYRCPANYNSGPFSYIYCLRPLPG